MVDLPDYLREFDDTAKTRQLIYDGCLEAVKNRFPVEDDNDNHGTHVAGIIASVLRGGDLFNTDAAPVPVKIMPLKIHGGEKASGSVANAIKESLPNLSFKISICFP